jgi:hypothetical protein
LKLSRYLKMHGKFYGDSVAREIKSPFSREGSISSLASEYSDWGRVLL